MIRSSRSLPWSCCGVEWPPKYNHCGFCGASVFTANKRVLAAPLHGPQGSWAVVTDGELKAADWRLLVDLASITAKAFEDDERAEALKPRPLDATPPLPNAPEVPKSEPQGDKT